MSKTPNLRFKEFSGEWEKTTLKQVSNGFEYGMNSASTEFDGVNKYIRITDIDEQTNKYLESNIVSPLDNLEDKYLVNENDILFARTGASTGKSYLYDKNDGKLYFAGFLIRTNINNDNNAKFIFLQTKTKKYENWVKVMSMRSGQPGINSQEYASYSFNSPSLEEQEKIASFFSLIDNKISLQSEKVEKLKEYKKGMMQKIFSREIRFKDDNGKEYPEWEEKKLGEIGCIVTGNTPSTNEKDNYGDEYLWASPVDLGDNKVVKDTLNKLSYKGFNKTRKVPKGSILVTCIGSTIGKIGIASEEMSTNQQINTLICNENMNIDFIYYSLEYNFKRYLSYVSYQAVPIINKSQFEELKVKVSSLEEQIKIGTLLSKIEMKIEKEQEKIDFLNEYKKGLLQQMFV